METLISTLHSFAMWVTFVTAVFGWFIIGVGYALAKGWGAKLVRKYGLAGCIIGIVVTTFALIVK